MALNLYIPPCIHTPPHPHHSPSVNKPLRISIEGPLSSVIKLLPGTEWQLQRFRPTLQPAAPELAKLAFRTIYGQDIPSTVIDSLVVRDEYLGWVQEDPEPWERIDYYGVTFDHLVPSDDRDPETLQINIIETDDDDAAYANMHLLFPVDAGEYRGKKVLAVPRCCSKRKGTTDRGRINESVIMKEELALKQAKWREQGIYPPADM